MQRTKYVQRNIKNPKVLIMEKIILSISENVLGQHENMEGQSRFLLLTYN